jgi:ABC-type sugar transport system ATPase subunit
MIRQSSSQASWAGSLVGAMVEAHHSRTDRYLPRSNISCYGADMSTAAIETHGLVREFKKGPRAVDGIDLRVEPGEVYGFLGPNGAGKSTTVHVLTTLLPPTAGTARVAGHDVVNEGEAVRAAIGAALQEAALDPFLTGREHMRLQTALHGMRGQGAVPTRCSAAWASPRRRTARCAATRAA